MKRTTSASPPDFELPAIGGALGLIILPGRHDYHRDIESDLAVLLEQNITHVLTLLGEAVLDAYGVGHLPERLREAGFACRQLPIVDQKVCSTEQAEQTVGWMLNALAHEGRIVVHCVGSLARSGMMAARVLKPLGLDTAEAMTRMRNPSPRAIER